MDEGGIRSRGKETEMAGSESTRATVYNKAGVGVRKMEDARWRTALITLIVLFVGIILYSMRIPVHSGH